MKKIDFNILAKHAVDHIANDGQNIHQETQKNLKGSAGGKIGGNAYSRIGHLKNMFWLLQNFHFIKASLKQFGVYINEQIQVFSFTLLAVISFGQRDMVSLRIIPTLYLLLIVN